MYPLFCEHSPQSVRWCVPILQNLYGKRTFGMGIPIWHTPYIWHTPSRMYILLLPLPGIAWHTPKSTMVLLCWH